MVLGSVDAFCVAGKETPEPDAAGVAFPTPNVVATFPVAPPTIAPVVVTVVNVAGPGVTPPIAFGDPQSAPSSRSALRFSTIVVEVMTSGAVPVASELVICPDAVSVVKLPAFPTTTDTRLNVSEVVPMFAGLVAQESSYRASALAVPSLTNTSVPSTASRFPSKSEVRVQEPVEAR